MNKTIWLTGVGLACLPTLLCAKQNTPPNILFILCDDMGYGDLALATANLISTRLISTGWRRRG